MNARMPEPEQESSTTADDALIGRAFRQSLLVIITLGLAAAVLAWWLRPRAEVVASKPKDVILPERRSAPETRLPEIPFTEITEAAGIRFVHESGAAGEKLLPETMGSGAAFFDFNNDDHPDLLLVNSGPWPWNSASSASPAFQLYQNDGHGQFQDVTAESGLSQVALYGMGVAIGDYDNDGWRDVFVTGVGQNRLLRNAQGHFVDVTDATHVGGDRAEWSTGAAWFDADRDGDLDLFVANYVRWSREIDRAQDFRLVGVGRAYGPPFSFQGTFPYFYRNDSNGQFHEVAADAGLQVRNPATDVPMAKSLGVLPIDLDRDGWMDLVVANDTVQNFLFRNQQDGTFSEMGAVSGIAFDSAGNARGAMGIDASYFRGDDTLGIAIGNFANEMTALYCSSGAALQFTDDALATGLGPPSRLDLKFGVLFADFDLDGRPDLAAANGHLEEEIHKVQVSQHYAQPPHLFWNCGATSSSEFVLLGAAQTGSDFLKPMVGRGLAVADIDGDGDLDLLLTANRGSPRLLRNDQTTGHHWLRVRLVDTNGQRDALGAIVEVTAGGRTQRQQVMPTRGYLSQSELPVTFGLGDSSAVEQVHVTWPDGTRQSFTVLAVDRQHVIARDRGVLP